MNRRERQNARLAKRRLSDLEMRIASSIAKSRKWIPTTEITQAFKLRNGQARRILRRLARSKIGMRSRLFTGDGGVVTTAWAVGASSEDSR